jgi:MOSC domain-containing protein YiiM
VADVTAEVTAVAASPGHAFSKQVRAVVELVAGSGVDGDAHAGATVKHRSRVARDASAPNLRQVHLIAAELHDDLHDHGFSVGPGTLGENVTTRGLDLLSLPAGTLLRLGAEAVVELTGLRNPCVQIERHAPGLLAAVRTRAADGRHVLRGGVMGVVVAGGAVRAGDPIVVALPAPPHRPLVRV